MTDILEEVLRDHYYERKVYYFKKFLPIVALITILSVIFMLVYGWYVDRSNQHKMQMGDILVKSVSSLSLDQPSDIKSLHHSLDNLTENKNFRVGEIAALKQVNLKLSTNDYPGAKLFLEKIIENNNYYEVTKAYARITWLALVIDQPKTFDDEKSKLVRYLQYFSDETKPFFGTASIIKATWYINNNELALALDTLKAVLAAHAPKIVKEQAKALLAKISHI